MSPARDHDVVIYGATGFVGRLTAEYLAGAAPAGARIALGGRSLERLEKVRAALPPAAADWPIVVADSGDAAEVAELARSTKVVATTVGPYFKYGGPLALACAEAGTHYADLTGEVLFVRRTIDACHKLAEASGARLVPSCGYDSIPSDLGVALLHQAAQADGAGTLEDTVLVARARGGFSGGTIDSMRTQIDELSGDKSRRKAVTDPYGLSPDRAAEPNLGDESDPVRGRQDQRAGGWLAPFVMGPYNTRIVRRSNALLEWAYGRSFRYQEHMPAGKGALGAVVSNGIGVGTGAFMGAMGFGPTRSVLDRVLPAPGAGPSAEARRKGWFRSDLWTTTTTDATYHARIAGKGDPGYAGTAVMLGQAALALALDDDRLPDAAGVLTPATAIGDALVERLRTAGFELTAEKA